MYQINAENISIKKVIVNGFISMKLEYMNEISTVAQGLLLRMVNVPECDYISAEEFQKLFPADSLEDIRNALEELCNLDYTFKSDDERYAVNKIKIIQNMQFIEPNCRKESN